MAKYCGVMFKSLTKVLDAIDEALPDQEEFDFKEFKKQWLGED